MKADGVAARDAGLVEPALNALLARLFLGLLFLGISKGISGVAIERNYRAIAHPSDHDAISPMRVSTLNVFGRHPSGASVL